MKQATNKLYAGFLFVLLFNPKDGGDMFPETLMDF
jgi:hypothetical protein